VALTGFTPPTSPPITEWLRIQNEITRFGVLYPETRTRLTGPPKVGRRREKRGRINRANSSSGRFPTIDPEEEEEEANPERSRWAAD